jgi:hypothetical protein
MRRTLAGNRAFAPDALRAASIAARNRTAQFEQPSFSIRNVMARLHIVTLALTHIPATHQCDLSVASPMMVTAPYLGMMIS